MRGYGQTEHPEAIDRYTLLHLVGDMVGVLDALGQETAVIAGHDWGAPVAWHAALLRPDRFRAVIGLSVPYRPRGRVLPTSVMPQTDDAVFYQLHFQTPGVAEAELQLDVRTTIRNTLLRLSGGYGHPTRRVSAWCLRAGGLLASGSSATSIALPAWLTSEDIDFYVGEFRPWRLPWRAELAVS